MYEIASRRRSGAELREINCLTLNLSTEPSRIWAPLDIGRIE